jgi:hypothetical protein
MESTIAYVYRVKCWQEEYFDGFMAVIISVHE